jgi:hypothetical protein
LDHYTTPPHSALLSLLSVSSNASTHPPSRRANQSPPWIPPSSRRSSTLSRASTTGTPTPRSESGRSTPMARWSAPCSATSSAPGRATPWEWRGSPGLRQNRGVIPPRRAGRVGGFWTTPRRHPGVRLGRQGPGPRGAVRGGGC